MCLVAGPTARITIVLAVAFPFDDLAILENRIFILIVRDLQMLSKIFKDLL